MLRVAITGGGCSGFQYEFRLDNSCTDDDAVLSRDGAVVLIDRVSLDFLKGAEIDFIDENGGRFVQNQQSQRYVIMRMRHEFFDLILIQFGVVNPFSQRRHGALFKDNLQGNIHAEFLMNFFLDHDRRKVSVRRAV